MTVYPKPMFDGKVLEDIINIALAKYFSGIHEELFLQHQRCTLMTLKVKYYLHWDSAKASVVYVWHGLRMRSYVISIRKARLKL